MNENLTPERITAAVATLKAASRVEEFPGAIGQEDHRGIFIEAKRNLTALMLTLHGNEEWEALLNHEY